MLYETSADRHALSVRNAKVLAKGLCATCYTLKRQDEEYFGGHREVVLKRDGYRCRVPGCTTVKRGKRSIAVHHREPGNSDPAKMVTLCLVCHAKVIGFHDRRRIRTFSRKQTYNIHSKIQLNGK